MLINERATPLKWRRQPPPHSAGTLYQFVREYICRNGGECGRSELLSAMTTDRQIAAKLAHSQGFARILWNMHFSGWIDAPGERIKATKKTRLRVAENSPGAVVIR